MNAQLYDYILAIAFHNNWNGEFTFIMNLGLSNLQYSGQLKKVWQYQENLDLSVVFLLFCFLLFTLKCTKFNSVIVKKYLKISEESKLYFSLLKFIFGEILLPFLWPCNPWLLTGILTEEKKWFIVCLFVSLKHTPLGLKKSIC